MTIAYFLGLRRTSTLKFIEDLKPPLDPFEIASIICGNVLIQHDNHAMPAHLCTLFKILQESGN